MEHSVVGLSTAVADLEKVIVINFIIHIDDYLAFSDVCDSVCPSVRTIKSKQLKLKSPNLAQ